MNHQHRPGPLKQVHRPFKGPGGHASKGKQRDRAKGRVGKAAGGGEVKALRHSLAAEQGRRDRKNHVRQARENKVTRALDRKSAVGTLRAGVPPKIVVVLPLSERADAMRVAEQLAEASGDGPVTTAVFSVPKWKSRVHVVVPYADDDVALLDAGKVADTVLLVLDNQAGVDEEGERRLSLLRAQGLVPVIAVVQGLEFLQPKDKQAVRKHHARYLMGQFQEEPRVMPIESVADADQVLRFACALKTRPIAWRDRRPYMLVDRVDVAGDGSGNVMVSGYARGGPLSANQLVHIADAGTFQMSAILGGLDPYAANPGGPQVVVSQASADKQETLVSENTPDLMMNEQTWPTAEELEEAEKQQRTRRRRLPKGMSDYQASWIFDDDDEEGGAADEDGDDVMRDGDGDEDDDDEEEEYEDEEDEDMGVMDDNAEVADEDEDDELQAILREAAEEPDDEAERQKILQAYKASLDDLEFPDEVDTPMDQRASVRFAKYRPLRNFRRTPWNPRENLPLDYGRIYRFENYKSTQKRSLAARGDEGVEGYITIQLVGAPAELVSKFDRRRPLVLGGLLRHENKMSVMNFGLQRSSWLDADHIVRSKDVLTFHFGWRRHECQPIFSENSSKSDKFRYERFLHAGRFSVASAYAPVTFAPCPLLVFQNGKLIATGTVLGADPDRVVLKRVILTGFPFKIHKRTSVVRYMFHNPQDIRYFKPVPLWTKMGRQGFIKESVGTHGYMKCVFDGVLRANDTVCASLYKRMFPKRLEGKGGGDDEEE